MHKPFLVSILLSCSALPLCAQQESGSSPQASHSLPEEVQITGSPSLQQLRSRMFEAEKNAYDIFNRFNDEERFMISCSTRARTGSLYRRESCSPRFELDARQQHARAYFENMRDYYTFLLLEQTVPDTTPSAHIPAEARIARQQPEYQAKLREVAQQHPEFLHAIIRYSELRQRYQEATGDDMENQQAD